MADSLEDKYSRFSRYFNIDIKSIEEAALGGEGADLSNYYTKSQADVISNALDARLDVLEATEVDLSDYYTKTQIDSGYGKKLVVRDAYVKTGNVTLPATASGGTVWEVLSGFATLSIPAAIGDRIDFSAHGMRSATASASMDIAVVVSGSAVIYLGSGTSTPLTEGDPGWYPQNNFSRLTGPIGFTVESGHLSSGNIIFAVVQKNTGGGTLYASNDYPFYWQAKNYGSVG